MANSTRAYWLACGALYLVALALLWPTLGYGPLPLDDLSLLREHADQPLFAVFKSDHFGHLRPAKNLTFQWLARDQERIVSLRVLLLATTLFTGLLVQKVAVTLISNRWLALLTTACWLLHPCTASTVAWLSTSNYVFALFLCLAYITLAARNPQSRPIGVLREVTAHVCLVLAALFLELAVVAPLAVWAYFSAVQTDHVQDARGKRLAVCGAAIAAVVVALHVALRDLDLGYRMAEHPRGQLALTPHATC